MVMTQKSGKSSQSNYTKTNNKIPAESEVDPEAERTHASGDGLTCRTNMGRPIKSARLGEEIQHTAYTQSNYVGRPNVIRHRKRKIPLNNTWRVLVHL